MPTLDERLRELAGATHAQLDPSPELYGRIRSATRRRVRPTWARAQALVAAAAVVAVVAGATVFAERGHTGRDNGATAPITRLQFIARIDSLCQQRGGLANLPYVVFPTAQGYAAVATSAITTVTQDIADTGPDAGAVAADAVPVMATVNTDLKAALAELQTAQSRGAAGDASGAKAGLDGAYADLNSASAALAAYGATACGPSPTQP